jgi:hypothetical protein
MDVSHITKLLSNLGRNQVTSPIKENDFQENKVADYYSKILRKDIFNSLDDILVITNRYKPNRTQQQVRNNTHNQPIKLNKIKNNSNSYNLVYALACIRDTMLTLEKRDSKILEVTNQFIQEMKDYVAQCTCKKLNLDTINNEKVSKSVLLDNLDNQHLETIVKVASRVLSLNLAVIDINTNVVCKEHLSTNTNHEEYLLVCGIGDGYMLGDSVQQTKINNKCIKQKISALKQQDNFEENLKNLSVKDLRNIAKDIGIDTVDTHTGKLYAKSDLKQLIEAQLKTII